MPNFDAKIRVDYRDIDDLCLDCQSSGLELDGSLWTNVAPPARRLFTGTHTGANNASVLEDTTQSWRVNQLKGCRVWNITDGSRGRITANTENTVTAILSGGTQNDWDTGESYVITTYRMGNPNQPIVANRPSVNIVSGFREAEFNAATSSYMNIPIDYPAIDDLFTISYEYTQHLTGSGQTLLGFPNLKILRTDGSGNHGYEYNATQQTGTGDMTSGHWMLQPTLTSTASMYQDNVVSFSGTYNLVDIAAGTTAGYIGTSNVLTDFCSCKLKNLQIWNRRLTALERDFAYKTINTVGEFNNDERADMTRPQWRDLRDGSLKQRINPTNYVPHRFILAEDFDTDLPTKVQIACTVDGNILNDLDLGGNLFNIDIIEYPSGVPATITQESSWTSIADVNITEHGHYTFLVSRPNGGQIILHLDVNITSLP